MMAVFIIPKYQQIFADMLEDETLPSASQALPMLPFQLAAVLAQVQIVIALIFYLEPSSTSGARGCLAGCRRGSPGRSSTRCSMPFPGGVNGCSATLPL